MTAESFASVMMGSAMRDDGPDREPRPVLMPSGTTTGTLQPPLSQEPENEHESQRENIQSAAS
jgi:hypothetical protein